MYGATRVPDASQEPVILKNATTRYGRVHYSLVASEGAAGYTVKANVALPPSYAAAATAPPGGVRLRLRAPVELAGKLSSVTVGGKEWQAFDAAAETIDFEAKVLTPSLLKALQEVVATWAK